MASTSIPKRVRVSAIWARGMSRRIKDFSRERGSFIKIFNPFGKTIIKAHLDYRFKIGSFPLFKL
jgi:hypothetical protein